MINKISTEAFYGKNYAEMAGPECLEQNVKHFTVNELILDIVTKYTKYLLDLTNHSNIKIGSLGQVQYALKIDFMIYFL